MMRDDREERLQELYGELEAHEMEALWRMRGNDPSASSNGGPYKPYLWKGAPLRNYMDRASELVRTGPEAERRVIILANPSLAPAKIATHSMVANMQIVVPGDVAPTHRHTATAIRFVIDGGGAATIVGGEPVVMHPG